MRVRQNCQGFRNRFRPGLCRWSALHLIFKVSRGPCLAITEMTTSRPRFELRTGLFSSTQRWEKPPPCGGSTRNNLSPPHQLLSSLRLFLPSPRISTAACHASYPTLGRVGDWRFAPLRRIRAGENLSLPKFPHIQTDPLADS